MTVIEKIVADLTSSLWYEAATGQYVYTWKTDAAWAGGCRKLIFTFKDGSRREAMHSTQRCSPSCPGSPSQ